MLVSLCYDSAWMDVRFQCQEIPSIIRYKLFIYSVDLEHLAAIQMEQKFFVETSSFTNPHLEQQRPVMLAKSNFPTPPPHKQPTTKHTYNHRAEKNHLNSLIIMCNCLALHRLWKSTNFLQSIKTCLFLYLSCVSDSTTVR